MRSKNLRRRSLAAALTGLVASLAACEADEPRVFVSVHVLADGTYTVNDKAVVRENLEEALTSLKPKGGRFHVGFQVALTARNEQVQYAMSIAQRLEALILVVGNEKF